MATLLTALAHLDFPLDVLAVLVLLKPEAKEAHVAHASVDGTILHMRAAKLAYGELLHRRRMRRIAFVCSSPSAPKSLRFGTFVFKPALPRGINAVILADGDEVAAGRDGHRRGDGEPAKQCRTAVPSSMTLEGV